MRLKRKVERFGISFGYIVTEKYSKNRGGKEFQAGHSPPLGELVLEIPNSINDFNPTNMIPKYFDINSSSTSNLALQIKDD